MMYQVTYHRDGKDETHIVTKAQANALADYLRRTFRIEVRIETLTGIGADR